MALVAQCIDRWHVQQSRILGAVRRVACDAPFSLDHSVFIDKRSSNICVTFDADHVLIGGRLELCVLEGAMRIVTVAALDRAF